MGNDYQGATHINLFFTLCISYAFNRIECRSPVKLYLPCYTSVLSGVRGRNGRAQRMFIPIQRIKLEIGCILSAQILDCELYLHTAWKVIFIIRR
jgi:hypothetical protein